MALDYRQTATASTCTADPYSTGKTGNVNDGVGISCKIGGVGSGTYVMGIDASAVDRIAVLFEITNPGGQDFKAGTWTVRLNVTASNANLTLASGTVIRINSDCSQVEQLGQSNALGISLSTTGVKTFTISCTAPTAVAATDKLSVILGFSNSAASIQAFTLTRDQDLTTPFDTLAPALRRLAPGKRSPQLAAFGTFRSPQSFPTPDPPAPPFALPVRTMGPGRRIGPFGMIGPRRAPGAYYNSLTASMSVPAGAIRCLAVAPTLTAGTATLALGAGAIRVLGVTPTLAPGAVSDAPAAAVLRLLATAPTFTNGSNVAAPAAVLRVLGVAPSLTAGSVSVALSASVVRVLALAPTLAAIAQLAPPAASLRVLALAPGLTAGVATRTPAPAVLRFVALAPVMTGGTPPTIVVDDRRRRFIRARG